MPASAALVREPVTFQAIAMRGDALEVHYRLGASNAPNSPFAVRYAEIGPWQPELDRDSLARVDTTGSAVLPRSFQRGTLRCLCATPQKSVFNPA